MNKSKPTNGQSEVLSDLIKTDGLRKRIESQASVEEETAFVEHMPLF